MKSAIPAIVVQNLDNNLITRFLAFNQVANQVESTNVVKIPQPIPLVHLTVKEATSNGLQYKLLKNPDSTINWKMIYKYLHRRKWPNDISGRELWRRREGDRGAG